MAHHSWTTDFCTFCGIYFGHAENGNNCPKGICPEPGGHQGPCPCA